MKNHDLSANIVKLDYNALLSVAKIAWGEAKAGVERALQEIQTVPIYKPNKSLVLTAKTLVQHAHQLALAIETVEALEGMRTRSELEILNKPVVKED